jgi:hypothetical protein
MGDLVAAANDTLGDRAGDHLQDFPVAAVSLWKHETGACSEMQADRGRTVLSERLAAGFGGLIVVMIILLAVQLLTGVRAFPL